MQFSIEQRRARTYHAVQSTLRFFAVPTQPNPKPSTKSTASPNPPTPCHSPPVQAIRQSLLDPKCPSQTRTYGSQTSRQPTGQDSTSASSNNQCASCHAHPQWRPQSLCSLFVWALASYQQCAKVLLTSPDSSRPARSRTTRTCTFVCICSSAMRKSLDPVAWTGTHLRGTPDAGAGVGASHDFGARTLPARL